MNPIKKFIRQLKEKKQNSWLYRSGWELLTGQNGALFSYTDAVEVIPGNSTQTKKIDDRIDKKPIEVFEEIISETPSINLNNLNAQIKMIKQRKDVIQKVIGRPASDEIEALGFLEARKKYEKNKDLFKWSIATFSKVEDLCKKYKLATVDFQNTTAHKLVPMEGILEIDKFVNAYEKVRDDHPVLKLIMEDKPEQKKRADPIIIASSPFGRWFYVLGAWDKEIEIIEELIYNKK
jgi:hypothetical protein